MDRGQKMGTKRLDEYEHNMSVEELADDTNLDLSTRMILEIYYYLL